MQSDNQNQSRPSMLSVPARWRELYFNVFSILCLLGIVFLVWYEIYRRDAESDYLDILMNILSDTGPVAMAAAIMAFMILKGRDAMFSTWETFAKRRYDKGREEGIQEGIQEGRKEGREEREALERRIAELEERYENGRADEREEGRQEHEALERRVAELEEQIRDMRNSNGSSQN